MNIVDSSFWLEYFAGTGAGNTVAEIIEDVPGLYVPAISVYEVFKKLLIETDENRALLAAAHMKQGHIIDLDVELSLSAARFGKIYKLPLADSIIYASTVKYQCTLWTQDRHFKGLELVNYFEKTGV